MLLGTKWHISINSGKILFREIMKQEDLIYEQGKAEVKAFNGKKSSPQKTTLLTNIHRWRVERNGK